MKRNVLELLTAGICFVSLILAYPSVGDGPAARRASEHLMPGHVDTLDSATTLSGSDALSPADASWSCLPRYGEPRFVLAIDRAFEPQLTSGDFDGDGLDDVVVERLHWLTYETFELDILLNDGSGGLTLATSAVFSGTVPAVQHPTDVVVADFNGDGRDDIFVADHGYDADPFPGYQNQLVLSAPGDKLVDATGNLPQRDDFTHSACAADVDADGDVDLYVGNTWGQRDIDPQILLNDGRGRFSVGENHLPPLVDLNQNGYTTCAFVDVDNDGDADLVLGDAGDSIGNEHSTPDSEVLLNDGAGVLALVPDAMPAKGVSSFDIAHDIEPIDLDGDAFVDLLMLYEGWEGPFEGWQGSYVQALVNNGDGTFRDETASRLPSLDRQVAIRALELRDLDRDSYLDILAFPWDDQAPNPLLHLNDGAGHFTLVALDFKVFDLPYVFLDIHGDGGHDIVLSTISDLAPQPVYLIRDLGCPVFLPLICRTS